MHIHILGICGTFMGGIAAIARAAPIPFGAPEDFARDDLRWRMAVPKGGAPGLDGVFPGPIEWITGMHPAQRLGDQGIRCDALTLTHPQIEAVGDAMRIDDPQRQPGLKENEQPQ